MCGVGGGRTCATRAAGTAGRWERHGPWYCSTSEARCGASMSSGVNTNDPRAAPSPIVRPDACGDSCGFMSWEAGEEVGTPGALDRMG